MKFCPICKTRYDEEILRFCTKDGTPLVEEGEPNFTALPSENSPDDLGEETVIRRKTPPAAPSTAQPVPDFETETERISSPRIVIPMSGEAEPEPQKREVVRASTGESVRRQPVPQKSNTAMIVFLTVMGTVVILAGATGIFWFLSNQNSGANQNANYNANFNSIDININTNLNVGNSLLNYNTSSNNANTNVNTNANANINVNLRTPTPNRTPTPTPTPNNGENENTNDTPESNVNSSTPVNTRPTPPSSSSPRPTPSASPRLPPPPPTPTNRPPVNAGILNGRAVSLPKPAYPPHARQMRATGQVAVQVLVDEAGNVTSARATSGNPLLRLPAEAAARQSKFSPVRVGNQAVPASGVVLYNFINQ